MFIWILFILLYVCIDAQSYNIRVDIDRTFVTRPLVGYTTPDMKSAAQLLYNNMREER
jgi:hypothetical protein